MSLEHILTQVDAGVGVITLNRPDVYNALNTQIKQELISTLTEFAQDDAVKSIILTGSGKGFCSGADLGEMASRPSKQQVFDDLTTTYYTIVKKLSLMHKPVIGAINGPMAGAGIGIGLACDYKIMSSNASMKFAFANISLVSEHVVWVILKHSR